MDQTPSTPDTSTPQPPDPQLPQSPPPPSAQPSSSLPQPSPTAPLSPPPPLPSFPNPNPIPNPQPPTSQSQQIQNSQSRPPFNRPSWAQQQLHSHFTHFSSSPSPPPVPPFSSSAAPSISSLPPPQRGGMAIGVPATPPPTFSPVPPPPFGQQFAASARNSVPMADSSPNSITSQVRQPGQGIQGMGMMGSLGSSSPMRPGGIPAQHQQRPAQSSLRLQSSPSNQSPAIQNFQGHSLLRGPSLGTSGPSLHNTSQSSQPHNQPWLPSGSQGKPPLPPPSYRPPQLNPQSMQQRSHISQPHHHHPMTNPQQQQQTSSGQQLQGAPSHQPQEHYGQQFPPSRIQQSITQQQQTTRAQGAGNQKTSSQAMIQPSSTQTLPPSTAATQEPSESCSRILSKRSIQELVTQIDPSETLDPEVEDILVDIADEFVDSITTFGCSLAKHRKSTTLEAKDILLHLERNWNMTLPGFSGDEIKSYRKPSASDIHRERLAAIKRSMIATETTNTRNSAGQSGGSAKSHLKAPANIIGSPNPKIREAA